MEKILSIFAWPIVGLLGFVIVLLIFRAPISKLMDRTKRAGIGSNSIDFSPVAEQQKNEPTSPDQAPLAVPPDETMPPPVEIYKPIEDEIVSALQSSGYSPEIQKAWLIRALAAARIIKGHETVYRLIVGSQLELLLAANSFPMPTMVRARQIYEAAKTNFPNVYSDFTFEAWLHFPLNSGIIKTEQMGVEQVLRTTPLGQDFLHYLVNNNLTNPKAG